MYTERSSEVVLCFVVDATFDDKGLADGGDGWILACFGRILMGEGEELRPR